MAADPPVLYEADIDLAPIRERTIALIGYGNHGRAHALTLRDYGARNLLIALRAGSPSIDKARADGFETVSIAEAAGRADALSLLAADEAHGAIWREAIAPYRKRGQALILNHGFSIEYGLIEPPVDADVVLAAAKGPGGAVREAYLRGGGLIGYWAVAQDASGSAADLAKAYVAGLGCGRAGVYETSFGEEALADIFGEQAVLVGGLCALARLGFETLVEAGVDPQMAYIDAVHEIKYIADLIQTRGIAGMYAAISDTAEFGAHQVEPALIEALRPVFQEIVKSVRSGAFARDWVADFERDRAGLYTARAKAGEHPLEAVGAALRARIRA